jgi:hypothetical protein
MPKDPTKNVDRYKIRGGTLNEFEYTENQGALADQKPKSGAKLIPGTPPEERDRPRPQVTKKAAKTGAKKSAAKATKATKSKKSTKKTAGTRGASAKKLAARKSAKKK